MGYWTVGGAQRVSIQPSRDITINQSSSLSVDMTKEAMVSILHNTPTRRFDKTMGGFGGVDDENGRGGIQRWPYVGTHRRLDVEDKRASLDA